MEAEREKERQENALQHMQTLSEKTMKKLDEEISTKNMMLECKDAPSSESAWGVFVACSNIL